MIEAKAPFFEALQKSKLLSAEELAAARQAAEQAADAKAVARLLVQKDLLTRWQAGQLLVGRTAFFVGRYKLLDLIGRGGMGKVYLARHTMMNRTVALKLVSERAGKDRATLDRFLTEARAIAALDHPNIVHAYNVDNEGDCYYMVLEYVEGQDLQRLVETEGPLDFQRAADYVRQAADGLAHAHAKGMIHCDIKPANLLVNPQGVVKILDMGMARLVDAAAQEGSNGGSAGGLVGTIDYMAPEQAAQSPEMDHRADLYSLGCTFYFLLTGHAPFPEGTLTERIAKHQSQEPRSIAEERPGAPRDLVKICQKMMAKDPAQRYQSAAELSAVLAEWRPPAQRVLRAVPVVEPEDEPDAEVEALPGDAAPSVPPADAAAPAEPSGGGFFRRLVQNRRRLAIAGGSAAAVLVLAGLLWAFLGRGGGNDVAKRDPTQSAEKAPGKRPEKTKPNPWGDLKAFDEKTGTGQSGTSPSGPATATPVPGKTDPAKPDPKADPSKQPPKTDPPKTDPGKTAPAKTEPPKEDPAKQPAKPAPPKEQPKPEPPKEPPKPAPPKEAPKPEPPKEPPKPEPPKPAPSGDPLKDFPTVAELPALEEGAASQPSDIGKIPSPADLPWELNLVGGDVAMRGARQFALARQDAGGKPSWTVTLSGRGKDEEPSEAARFYREKDTLVFQWAEKAEAAANHLCNCFLEVRAGGAPRLVPLREPAKASPLMVDFQIGAAETLEVQWLPNPSAIRLEITKIEPGGAKKDLTYLLEPREPVAVKAPVTVGLTRKDIFNVEKPVFSFQVAALMKGQSLSVDLRFRKEVLAAFKGYDPQRTRLLLTNPLRELEQQLRVKGKENDPKLRLQKDALDLEAWRADTYQALHKAGRVHFRVYAEVGNQQLVLARTEPPSKPPAK